MSDARDLRGPAEPIPLTVLTGFLGAGKTSLLNRLLSDPALAQTAVIINEFGEIGLDHLLVRPIREGVVLLQSGCLCCTLRGDLVDALEQLLRDLDNGRALFRRVILETTGLADPAPVLQTAMTHPYLLMRYRLDGVIVVVDAVHGAATLDAQMEAVKQVAVADRIVLSKTDLVSTPEQLMERKALTARLAALNPAAPILDVAAGEATPAALLGCGLYDPERKIPDVARWLAVEAYAAPAAAHAHRQDSHAAHPHDAHHHDAHRHDPSRHDDRIDLFLELLRSQYGDGLLRLKGIVKLAERPERPLVIHAVQHCLHPALELPSWPDGDQRTRIVLITRDLDPVAIDTLLHAFLGASTPDRADRAALLDNPLLPFGGIDR